MGEDQPGCRWIHRPIRSTDQALSLSNRASLSEQGWMLGWFGGAHTKEDFHADADVVAYRANWLFTCPYWAPFALFAALPIMRVVTGVGRRRRVRGLRRASRCTTCGYDLRATPDRCPECGTVA
jgi:hypothetical protein